MTLAQIAAFWSFFLIVVPAAVVYVEHRLPWHALRFEPLRALAALLFLGCSSLGFWSGMSMAARGRGTPLPFASPNRLVISGPYACVRNPMVIAGLGQGLAVALWLGSWTVVAYVLLGGAIWSSLVRPAEERDLRETFGIEYDDYCRQVRCWRPRLRPFVTSPRVDRAPPIG
jgi:protein-S-isoprenylcysteine O-methyltransferase Ste14